MQENSKGYLLTTIRINDLRRWCSKFISRNSPPQKTRFEMHCDLIESLPLKTVLCCTLSAPQDKHTLQGAEQDIIFRLTLE